MDILSEPKANKRHQYRGNTAQEPLRCGMPELRCPVPLHPQYSLAAFPVRPFYQSGCARLAPSASPIGGIASGPHWTERPFRVETHRPPMSASLQLPAKTSRRAAGRQCAHLCRSLCLQGSPIAASVSTTRPWSTVLSVDALNPLRRAQMGSAARALAAPVC